MLNKIRERLTTTRRHRIAMRAARNAVIYSSTSVTPDDVLHLAYGAHGIHHTPPPPPRHARRPQRRHLQQHKRPPRRRHHPRLRRPRHPPDRHRSPRRPGRRTGLLRAPPQRHHHLTSPPPAERAPPMLSPVQNAAEQVPVQAWADLLALTPLGFGYRIAAKTRTNRRKPGDKQKRRTITGFLGTGLVVLPGFRLSANTSTLLAEARLHMAAPWTTPPLLLPHSHPQS